MLLPLVGLRGAWAATAVLTLGALLAASRNVTRAATATSPVRPLPNRGVPRWVLLVGGSTSMGGAVWVLHDPGLPLWSRIAAAVAFSLTAGVVPSAAFGGVGALTAGTGSAGPAMGLHMRGSSLGQLPVPLLVASATASWTAAPGILSGLAAHAVLGGLLFRRRAD